MVAKVVYASEPDVPVRRRCSTNAAAAQMIKNKCTNSTTMHSQRRRCDAAHQFPKAFLLVTLTRNDSTARYTGMGVVSSIDLQQKRRTRQHAGEVCLSSADAGAICARTSRSSEDESWRRIPFCGRKQERGCFIDFFSGESGDTVRVKFAMPAVSPRPATFAKQSSTKARI